MLIRIIGIFGLALQSLAADSSLRIPPGFKAELIANESTLSNVVAFSIDQSNRIFVAETHRNVAMPEISEKEENALVSVEDRAQLLQRKFKRLIPALTNQSERVLLLEDKNNDGHIDLAKVFARNFNRTIDGLAGGLLAHNGAVYFACAPDLWRLRENSRESIHTGFGVRFANATHNLRNLTPSPDGWLYFTMGDQGFNVTAQEGTTLAYPNEGAILRCELNGARLEVIARGFKNPRGLAFNELGDLFAIDGNRLFHVVEGMNATNSMAVETFPKGLTALAARENFYLSDSEAIYSLKLKAKGLKYESGTSEVFIAGAAANHIQFGPRPGIYFSEFRGRIYRVFQPSRKPPKSTNEIVGKTTSQLTAIALNPTHDFARQALWKLAESARNEDAAAQQTLLAAVRSTQPEIRAQAAKALGDVTIPQVGPALLSLLIDPEPRVQFFAVQSLGRLKHTPAHSPLTLLSTQASDPQLLLAIRIAQARL